MNIYKNISQTIDRSNTQINDLGQTKLTNARDSSYSPLSGWVEQATKNNTAEKVLD